MSTDYLQKLEAHRDEIADISGELATLGRCLARSGLGELATELAMYAKQLNHIQAELGKDYGKELNDDFQASWGAIADTLKATVEKATKDSVGE